MREFYVSVAWLLLSLTALSNKLAAQQDDDFNPETVVTKISARKHEGIGVKGFMEHGHERVGTGWRIGEECNLVVSAYHVAKIMDSSAIKINGRKIAETYLATGPNDPGAVRIEMADKSLHSLRYVPVHDLAVFRLKKPLPCQGTHGVGVAGRKLQRGEHIRAYGYPRGGMLTMFSGKFLREFADGMLEFEMQPSKDGATIGPGLSGGLIVNEGNQAVGVAGFVERGNRNMLQAIPIWVLADYLRKIESPEFYARLIPGTIYRTPSPVTVDIEAEADVIHGDEDAGEGAERDTEVSGENVGINPTSILPKWYLQDGIEEWLPPLKPRNLSGEIHRRTQEPADVQMLRKKAQELGEGMRNFIALQKLEFGFENTRQQTREHEVRVVYGHQTFRKWPDGKKEGKDLPFPSTATWVMIDTEWKDLPDLLATDLDLRIEQDSDRIMEGQKLKVFRFEGVAEDSACIFKSHTIYIPYLWHRDSSKVVPCRGEAWTDEQFNILRITVDEDLTKADADWRRCKLSVLYGWLNEPGEERKLIPVSIALQVEFNGRPYWCRGEFKNYRMFAVKGVIKSPSESGDEK